jgi:hypothetical protein
MSDSTDIIKAADPIWERGLFQFPTELVQPN